MLLSVCRSWAAWCKLNNRKWFPAEPEDVRDYLLYLQARGLAVKTIQQHLGQLNMLHRRSGLPRPSDSNAVSLVMRRIRKENVDAGERAKQALAFERTDFDQFVHSWKIAIAAGIYVIWHFWGLLITPCYV